VSELHFPWSSLIVHRLSVMQAFWRARKRSSITKFPLRDFEICFVHATRNGFCCCNSQLYMGVR
jgi:hypothetical protein